MPLHFEFDFINPDYNKVMMWRIKMLAKLRADPDLLLAAKHHYKNHPADFISYWGNTFDPRNSEIGLPNNIPFILFEAQEEWIEYVLRQWRNRESGITQKSRDMGVTWLAVALSCTLCMFNESMAIGFGSAKAEYVDKIGDPKSIFWKARTFMQFIPKEFRGSWNAKTDAPEMRILFRDTNSSITGEGGDNIGRGDRKSIYFVDEAAHVEHPALIDASLSNTTNCRQDISSVKGLGNSFAQKVHSGKYDVFTMHWRRDPRKSPDVRTWKIKGVSGYNWYEMMSNKLDEVTLAQEVDINYSASAEGVVIPSAWVNAAIDAAAKLGFEVLGDTIGALDVADQGIDLNAMAIRKGIQLEFVTAWSGKGSDTFATAVKAFSYAEVYGCSMFKFDADGIGAGIRGDSRVINEERKKEGLREIKTEMFHGSAAVVQPEKKAQGDRKNKDFFKNLKAQSWWALREKFRKTFHAVSGTNDEEYDSDDLISISSNIEGLDKLILELSQPTYSETPTGKILIDKAPDNTRSPNMADAVMMLYSPHKRAFGLFS